MVCYILKTQKLYVVIMMEYLHLHYESLNEPLHLRCGSYLHLHMLLVNSNFNKMSQYDKEN